jgi:cell fate regulator YaaT (PSP1 superfamily)
MADGDFNVAGVRFRNAGKIFYFHSAGIRLEPGEYVVVESTRGPEVGKVVIGTGQVVVNELGDDDLRPILRLATDADIQKADALRRKAQEEVIPEARRIAGEVRFPARVDHADYTLDGRRLTLSFSSEERLDYRELLRQAGSRFGVKVDMRQLGARDRAKQAGGYGICGRELCCSNWLTTFPAISIRMAKEQELPLNPQKISGLCGRLLCCLSYEEEGYREMRQTLPRVGQRCSTPTGEAKVIGVNILKRQVTLWGDGQRIEVGDRDLGTVVRWDPSSRSATPPPSLERREEVAAGVPNAEEAASGRAQDRPPLGRLPATRPQPKPRGFSQPARETADASSQPEGLRGARSRAFERRPGTDLTGDGTTSTPQGGRPRRRRRGGRGDGGDSPQA